MDVTESRPHAALAELIADLEQKISLRTAGKIRDLRVEAAGDAVILTGRTATYYMKQLATQIAMDEYASLPLQNSIDVV
jgi:osmotically-inducible protein OsmY